ncbi:MAG: LysM peptidoglycan-binding domain-containing protein [Phycisphaeraceae bacterium]|nr:LysM peptidoglycan-binding domain-containing protein [Phycisphaeraceae bacterium]
MGQEVEMRGGAYRLLGGFAALALVWVAVYWAVEPPAPPITFDAGADAADVIADGDEVPIETIAAAAPPDRRGPAVVPPEFEEYVVRGGDTFQSIARARYGSARHAEAVARANPFVSPDRLRAGQTLRLPVDPTNVQGKPIAGDEPTEPRMPVEYVVKQGDTLTGIARAFYGTTREADRIFEANRDRLRSRDSLRVGQVILLPPGSGPPGSG